MGEKNKAYSLGKLTGNLNKINSECGRRTIERKTTSYESSICWGNSYSQGQQEDSHEGLLVLSTFHRLL